MGIGPHIEVQRSWSTTQNRYIQQLDVVMMCPVILPCISRKSLAFSTKSWRSLGSRGSWTQDSIFLISIESPEDWKCSSEKFRCEREQVLLALSQAPQSKTNGMSTVNTTRTPFDAKGRQQSIPRVSWASIEVNKLPLGYLSLLIFKADKQVVHETVIFGGSTDTKYTWKYSFWFPKCKELA